MTRLRMTKGDEIAKKKDKFYCVIKYELFLLFFIFIIFISINIHDLLIKHVLFFIQPLGLDSHSKLMNAVRQIVLGLCELK